MVVIIIAIKYFFIFGNAAFNDSSSDCVCITSYIILNNSPALISAVKPGNIFPLKYAAVVFDKSNMTYRLLKIAELTIVLIVPDAKLPRPEE